ncbi:hypothetical protein ABZV60_11160 [Streptomyces sp. NPDC004787]|uniref:hypothetical protein n=1 Tax=Streptomyces sp. NPDC004787 TaxID=3154291 RepID=UPI00339FFE42
MTESRTETWTGLGAVTAPSGVLVLGMGGGSDHWPGCGPPRRPGGETRPSPNGPAGSTGAAGSWGPSNRTPITTGHGRAGWDQPLAAGVIDVAGCRVLGIGRHPGDHATRHRGERQAGRVHPVTLHPDADGGSVLRWTVPHREGDDEQEDRA